MNNKFINSHSYRDLERLDHEKTFNEQNAEFKRIIKSLDQFYTGYTNKEKIIQLLSAWLYFFRSLHESYGFDAVKDFSQNDFGCPIRFSFFYEYDFDINNKSKIYKNKYLFKILNGFLSNALLPGSVIHSIYCKLRWRFAKFIVVNIPVNITAKRKALSVKHIMDYFNGYFSEQESQEIEKYISDALPSVFYEEQINVLAKNPLNVECAPWTFLEFSGYERIFLLNRHVKVTGLQHGGGYFAFEPQYGTRFEESISEKFIGWGLSPQYNERQHRYPRNNKGLNSKTVLRRLIWVEHCRLSIFNYFMWPRQIMQSYNTKAIKYISDELKKVKTPFYSMPYPNHLRSKQYDGIRGTELSDPKGRGENIIVPGDILIFDESGSSLIHHCIEQEIPFILVLSRNDINGFSKQQNEWFDVIRESELAFFDDEIGMMSEKINGAFKSNFYIPKELKEFHKKVFIDI